MIEPDWTSEDGSVVLYRGDCLEVLRSQSAMFADSVITDPPYIIGASSVGNAATKAGDWVDMMNAAEWYALWLRECKRLTHAESYIAAFGNWRGLPTYMRAFNLAGLQAHSCLVWDKEWIGPAYKNSLRPRWELALISAGSEAEIPDRSAADVFRAKWMAGAMRCEHPAEKSPDVVAYLVENLSRENWIVLDPFMGSGTTGVACIRTGRKFIGIEQNEGYFEIAKKRIQQAIRERDEQLIPA